MDTYTLGAAIAIAGTGGGGGGGDLPSGGSPGDVLEKTANGTKWSDDVTELKSAVNGKQAAPATAGTAGQVLSLNSSLAPVWADATQAPTVTVVTPASGSTFTLDPCPVTYSFGEKAELTVTVTALSQFHFMFACPSSAATVLTINGETMRCGDELEAGKLYEVDIWAGITRVSVVEGVAVT